MLTVDARDNERDQLAGVIVAALVDRGAVVPEEIDATLPATTLLDAAFAQLEQRSTKRVLVLDDLQELPRHALRTLAYLVERAPASLDLVLCSRADPHRLARLRLEDRRGDPQRQPRVRLGRDLHAPDRPRAGLTRAQVRALWQRTEGWVAGLRLAAYALQGEADPAEFVQGAAGTETAIADYLLGAAHPPGRGHPAVHAPDECGRPADARSRRGAHRRRRRVQAARRAGTERGVLRRARGPHLVPLPLAVRDAPRGALRQQHRALADELHRRATWFIANDMPGEAEVHARAAGTGPWWGGSPPNAGSRGPRWRRHERRPAGGGAGQAIAADESLTILAAAEACSRRDRRAAGAHRAFVDGRAPDSAAGADPTDPLTSVPPLARPLLAVCYARAFGADARARAAIADLRGADDAATTARLAELRAIGLDLDDGRIERARRKAAALAQAADLTWIGTEALALLALADAVEGDLVAAALRAERVLDEPSPTSAAPRRHAGTRVAARPAG